MNAAGRLALYAGGLVLAFGAAFVLGDLLVPESFVEAWMGQVEPGSH